MGLPNEHTEDQDTLPGGVASVLVEITVKITQRIQKVHRSLYRTNYFMTLLAET